MSSKNRNRNSNSGKNDFPWIPLLIAGAFFIPGFFSVGIPLFILYEVLKNVADIDLIVEAKKVLGIDNEKDDHTHQESAPRPRSSVRKTDDPCGNEGYHSTFGEANHMPPKGKVVSTQEDPCGNEAYHGTFHEEPSEKKTSKSTQTRSKSAPSVRANPLRRFSQKIKDGKRMSGIGLGCGLLFSACAVVETIESFTTFGFRGIFTEDVLTLVLFSLISFGFYGFGKFKTAKANRFRKLRNIIGEDTTHISIHALADAVGYSDSKTEKLVQEMVDEGLLGDTAYIDVTTGYLILDGRGVDKEGLTQKKKAPTAEELDVQILREIRRVNADIPDPVLTRKISRIEEITGHILDYQKKHPEKTPELRKFLDYYLPTTLKILNTYAELDQKGLNGDNATATKERIEKMMDNVVEGFETQLDKLFEGEMLDISSDITVMEKMMSSDGLTGGFKIPKMDTEAVADDAFQTIQLTMEKMEPTRPISEPAPQPTAAPSEPVSIPSAYSGIQLTLDSEESTDSPDSDRMFESIHQSLGGSAAAQASSAADDMFQSIHLSLSGEDEQQNWQNGFYHHKKDELEEE